MLMGVVRQYWDLVLPLLAQFSHVAASTSDWDERLWVPVASPVVLLAKIAPCGYCFTLATTTKMAHLLLQKNLKYTFTVP